MVFSVAMKTYRSIELAHVTMSVNFVHEQLGKAKGHHQWGTPLKYGVVSNLS